MMRQTNEIMHDGRTIVLHESDQDEYGRYSLRPR